MTWQFGATGSIALSQTTSQRESILYQFIYVYSLINKCIFYRVIPFLFFYFSGLTAIATYFLTKELWNSRAGLFAACFIAIGTVVYTLGLYNILIFHGRLYLLHLYALCIFLQICLYMNCLIQDSWPATCI